MKSSQADRYGDLHPRKLHSNHASKVKLEELVFHRASILIKKDYS